MVVVPGAHVDRHLEPREGIGGLAVLVGVAVVGDVAGDDHHVEIVIGGDVVEHGVERRVGVVGALTALGGYAVLAGTAEDIENIKTIPGVVPLISPAPSGGVITPMG